VSTLESTAALVLAIAAASHALVTKHGNQTQ
jgi:hypothetical protein